ncbi:MAG: polysaccharide pyruvyl transferase CsaB [Cyanobacteria bacterium P01_H01_bin.15]
MAQKRAMICGYYGQGNGGDEALLVTLLQMLPPAIRPLVLSANPWETHERYDVDSIPGRNGLALLQGFRQSDFFIWGGGSLLQDATSWASPIYYTGLMALAQQQGLKTIAWGQGLGPFNRPLTRWLARQTLSSCTAVSVRDSASAALLADWQIPVNLAPDPVWALEGQQPSGLWDLPAPRIAVNLRSHPLLTPHRLETLVQALKSFQQATGVFVLLIPFQASKDLPYAQAVAAQLPEKSAHILEISNPRELKGLYQGVEMAIGMRLHSLIMAAAEECRCFALSYDPKVTQLMQETGMPGWELGQLPTDANTISTAWLNHYTNGEPLTPTQIAAMADRARLHQTLLSETCQ